MLLALSHTCDSDARMLFLSGLFLLVNERGGDVVFGALIKMLIFRVCGNMNIGNLIRRSFCVVLIGLLPVASTYSQWTRAANPGSQWPRFAVIGTDIFIGCAYVGVSRSTDDGSNWSQANAGLTNLELRALLANDANLYAGSNGGVFLSTDRGASWSAVSIGLVDTNVSCLAFSHPSGASGTNLFAGTASAGVFLSTDNGTSWTAVNNGLPTGYGIRALAVSGTNLLADAGSGVFLSTNSGTSWTTANAPFLGFYCATQIDSNLYVGSEGGVFRSTNNGVTWFGAGTGPSLVYALAATHTSGGSGTSLIAGTYHGVFVSTDDGGQWMSFNTGLTDSTVCDLAVCDMNLFLATNNMWRRPLSDATAPTVSTLAATLMGSTAARLNGTVNSQGIATTAWFDWGTDSAFTTHSSTSAQNVGSGSISVAISDSLKGILTANTKYYFRIVAQNSSLTASGPILSFTTAVLPANSESDFALHLNGSTDFVYLPPSNSMKTFADKITLEMWVKLDSFVDAYGVGATLISSGNQAKYGITIFPDGKLSVYLPFVVPNYSVCPFKSKSSLPLHTWCQVAATYDGARVSLLINGVVDTSVVATGNIGDSPYYTQEDEFAIGAYTENNYTLHGDYTMGAIDELRIWNIARTQSQIQATMGTHLTGSEAGLVGYWSFDGDVKDKSPNHNDGTIYGSPVFVQSGWMEPAPTLVSGIPSVITSTGATLNGTVNPNGSETTAWFDWGTDSTLSSHSSTSVQNVGGGTAETTITDSLKGVLSANTKYFVRVVAENSSGNVYGGTRSFTTLAMLTPETVQFEYSVDAHTLGLWHMDESSGLAAIDDLGMNNGVVSGTSIVPGRFGNCRYFNAPSDNVSLTFASSYKVQDFTMEAWVCPTCVEPISCGGQNPCVIGGVDGQQPTDGGMALGMYPDLRYVAETRGSNGSNSLLVTSLRPAEIGKWTHVALTRKSDGSNITLKLYVNGMAVASGYFPATQAQFTNTSHIYFGDLGDNLGNGHRCWFGYIDEVRLSNIARDPKEFNLQLPPSALSVKATATAVDLNWLNGGGAVGLLRYKVYRGTDSTSVALLDSTVSNSYTSSKPLVGVSYYYRVSAVDSTGFEGSLSYASNPISTLRVNTLAATSIGSTTARLNGTVNPNGVATTAWFDWGTDSTFSTHSSTSVQNVGAGTAEVAITDSLKGVLSAYTKYFFRIVAQNPTSTTDGATLSFVTALPTYPSSLTLSGSLPFPTNPNSSDYVTSDYRLMGIPGNSGTSVATLFSGTSEKDWRVSWDNGNSSNFIVRYDGSSAFVLSTGKAFWVLNKGTVNIQLTVPSAPLNTNQEVEIPLHAGWNLITNPFTSGLSWVTVQAINSVSEPIYAFADNFATSADFTPYVGYYYYNSANASVLRIPYAALFKPSAATQVDPACWRIAVSAASGAQFDHSTSLGVAPAAELKKQSFNYHKPRALGDLISVGVSRPDLDAQYPVFATDIRPDGNQLHEWHLKLRAQMGSVASLTFSGVDRVPLSLEVWLIDQQNARTADLRRDSVYKMIPATPTCDLSVLIGEHSAVAEELASVTPKEFSLGQNFPNPFNPSTTIPVAIPRNADVSLRVYDILGREIKTIYAGGLETGRYWFPWNGTNQDGKPVASGAYLVLLQSLKTPTLVTKLLLMK